MQTIPNSGESAVVCRYWVLELGFIRTSNSKL